MLSCLLPQGHSVSTTRRIKFVCWIFCTLNGLRDKGASLEFVALKGAEEEGEGEELIPFASGGMAVGQLPLERIALATGIQPFRLQDVEVGLLLAGADSPARGGVARMCRVGRRRHGGGWSRGRSGRRGRWKLFSFGGSVLRQVGHVRLRVVRLVVVRVDEFVWKIPRH